MGRIDTEYFLILFFIIISGLVFVDAYTGDYHAEATHLPLATSGLILLLIGYVFIAKNTDRVQQIAQTIGEEGVNQTLSRLRTWAHETLNGMRALIRSSLRTKGGLTFVSSVIFVITAYYIGLLIMGPVFLFLYMVASRISLIVSVLLSLGAAGIVYFIMDSLNLYNQLGGILY